MSAATDPARLASYRCLEAVEAEGAYANLAMPGILSAARLSGRDAAFATELAYGSIRMRGLYDEVIASASGRAAAAIDAPVLRALRLGAHQVLGMRVPPHAAVSQTVGLVRFISGEGPSRFANAVMRRITEASREEWLARVVPGEGPSTMAIRTSHPEWIVAELSDSLAAWGREGELAELLEAHNTPASVVLAVRPGLADRDALAASFGGTPTRFSPLGVTLAGGDPGAIPAVRDGRAAPQDEGSQIVALALSEAELKGGPRSSEAWLDSCAGPGGKAALLGAVAAQRGATLDARELHPHRAALVGSAVRALPSGVVSVQVGDSTSSTDGPYDRILVDAPCTGLGALRRRPESRWNRTEGDLEALVPLQRSLLANGLRQLTPGGVLAYVTCSPALRETRGVIDHVLAVFADADAAQAEDGEGELEVIDAREAVARVTGTEPGEWGEGPYVQLWTHAHGTDSMFLALIRRGLPRPPAR